MLWEAWLSERKRWDTPLPVELKTRQCRMIKCVFYSELSIERTTVEASLPSWLSLLFRFILQTVGNQLTMLTNSNAQKKKKNKARRSVDGDGCPASSDAMGTSAHNKPLIFPVSNKKRPRAFQGKIFLFGSFHFISCMWRSR